MRGGTASGILIERGTVLGVGDVRVFTVVDYMFMAKVILEFLRMSRSLSVGGGVTTVVPVERKDGGAGPCPGVVMWAWSGQI